MRSSIFFFSLALSSCASISQHVAAEGALLPSDLIKDKKTLDGNRLEVSGYMVADFEDRGIWDNEYAYKKYNSESSCVSLLIPNNMLDEMKKRSGSYVVINGKLVGDLRLRGTVVFGMCNFVGIEVQGIN